MDDFRRPYEYTEEKRGLILLFVIMLITVDIFHAPLYIMPVYKILKHIPVLGIGFMVISIIYSLLNLLTAFTCYNLKKNMVALSKIYLIVRAIFMVCCIILLFINNVQGKTMIGIGNQYSTIGEYTISGLIAPVVFELIFSGVWYFYFIKSKRCKELVSK